MRKLGFKLRLTEAELSFLDAYKKRECISTKKFTHSYYSSGNSPRTLTLSYSIKYLSRIIFCECVLGVHHLLHAEDFAHFGQKEQSKIKMKLKQLKSTRDSPKFHVASNFWGNHKTQLYNYFCGKDKNPAIWLVSIGFATTKTWCRTLPNLILGGRGSHSQFLKKINSISVN